jgi:hypothetical protein
VVIVRDYTPVPGVKSTVFHNFPPHAELLLS